MSTPIGERKLHLVGIGGAGMSGLALVAAELGATVSGSDRSESSFTERLRDAGVDVAIGHDASNVPDGAELVISTAIPAENPELVAAKERGMSVLHRSELLAELAALKEHSITVAGSHGKTTTTAMIAHVLTAMGEDPAWFVGGEVQIGETTSNAHFGRGKLAVVEADESDGSFLRYAPEIAVITNIEFEHPERWSGFDELLAAFAQHVATAEWIVAEHELERRDELGAEGRMRTFSTRDPAADYFAELLDEHDERTGERFRLGELTVELGVRGEHNVKNALAALAALELAGHSLAEAAEQLSSFRGVARRFELIGETPGGAVVYDDYAHHPTEVRAALTTARKLVSGDRRLVVFYQPHLFSRAKTYRREFAEALVLADEVVVLDIYPARERAEDFAGFTGWAVACDVADRAPGRVVRYAPNFDDAETLAQKLLRSEDLCVVMGAGSITELSRRLVGGQVMGRGQTGRGR